MKEQGDPPAAAPLYGAGLFLFVEAAARTLERLAQQKPDRLFRLLMPAEGNVSEAARLARRNRSGFYKPLSRHDIRPGDLQTGWLSRSRTGLLSAADDSFRIPRVPGTGRGRRSVDPVIAKS